MTSVENAILDGSSFSMEVMIMEQYVLNVMEASNMSNLKPGDIVKNIISVRSNPAVNESRGWSPIEAGTVGIVLAVRQTDLNAEYRRSGKGDVYVDVLMSTPSGPWKAGNYMQGFFKVITNTQQL